MAFSTASQRRRAIAATATAAMSGLLLAACGGTEGGGSGDTTDLRAIGTLPIGNYGSDALEMMKESIEEQTDGSVTVTTFPAGQLYNDSAAVDAIPGGQADIGIVQMDFWTGKVNVLGALYIPMLYDSPSHFYDARAQMVDTLNENMQEHANSRIVGWFNYSPQTLVTSAPVNSVDDFTGMKIRGWGEYSSAFFDAAGADAVVMSAGDVYDAIQRGTIDGALSAWTSMEDRSFYEVGSYMYDANIQPVTAYALVINNDVWEGLSDEEQAAIQTAGEEMDQWSAEQMDTLTADSIEYVQEQGIEIIEWDESTFREIQDATLGELRELYEHNTGGEGAPLLDMVEDARSAS
ncbi:TRAP transporter substrate-binding protein [Ornithinimicrobium faecis]|uniref:TRAP transporter substrate-binding protein n=1 Tax=Ornithinimicrobium faecis TaxID=2934158 RepID=UPI002118BD04|nr:TRAP transporter substrate-binding protein DctP [Ornithinimicrobium sp. HY1745]